MSHVIGIDLGTTNSCVAVPESADIPRKEELLATRRLIPAGGALVITNQRKEKTTASAVWVDQDGTVVVGSRAKKMARRNDVPPPALFFKRAMGTDQQVTAGYRTMTPEEASAHVLAHLKAIAEEVLGEPVCRAIITVPAFFETKAKNLTTEAGERAGLEVVETLLEPVAAALMYTRTRELVDPTTFMVYDLGGGTFDDSIVRWDPDIGFENRSFDGNPYLGGYDFDWQIVKWMIAELDSYDLDLEVEDPRDQAIRSQLLSVAEVAKHDLSREPEAQIVETTISDRTGTPMNINLYLPREDFEQKIEEDLRGTLASCARALAKADVRAADLSGIVMVGGSSRIPFVRQLLADEYHQEPVVIDPDLCVAVGAALKAATVATRSSYLTVERPPATTSLTSIDVSGRVSPGEAIPSAGGVTVTLSSDDGAFRRQEITNADGGFLFTDVELREEAENGFTVQVLVGAQPVDSQKLVAVHDWDAGARDVIPEGDILAHDYSVAVQDGRSRIAKAGTKLPYRAATVNLETATQRGEVLIEFYERNRPVGKVVVPDLPPDLPIGSPVFVTLEFCKGWTISGSATIPVANKTVPVEMQLPKMAVPSWSELRQDYRQIRASFQEMEGTAPPAELLRVGPQIDDLLRRAKHLMDEQHDPIQTHAALSEARTLLEGMRLSEAKTTALYPPLSEFEAAIDELNELVNRIEGRDSAKGAQHRSGIEPLRAAGLAAYEAGIPVDWSNANETVRRRINAAQKDLGEGQGAPPPAPILQLMLAEELRELIDTINQANRTSAGRFASRFDQLTTDAEAVTDDVMSVDLSDERAASQRLIHLYHASVRPLRGRIDKTIREAFAKVDSGPGVDLRLPRSSIPGAGA
ncbi:MAG: Hsp70 family protein [Pseudonocardiaceae bacterium]